MEQNLRSNYVRCDLLNGIVPYLDNIQAYLIYHEDSEITTVRVFPYQHVLIQAIALQTKDRSIVGYSTICDCVILQKYFKCGQYVRSVDTCEFIEAQLKQSLFVYDIQAYQTFETYADILRWCIDSADLCIQKWTDILKRIADGCE